MLLATRPPIVLKKLKKRLRREVRVAFPLPRLLPRIEELLQEVQWLDGLILVTDSERASFVSFSQVDPLLRRLRKRPKGPEVAEKLCMTLLESHGKGGSKPVLVFQGDGSFWLGVIGTSSSNPHRHHAIAHLHRCLELQG